MTVQTFTDTEKTALTPALDNFIDRYVNEHIEDRIDEQPDPCPCFVEGFLAGTHPADFDEMTDAEQDAVEAEGFEKLASYQFDILYTQLIDEAIELYKAYHEIVGDIPEPGAVEPPAEYEWLL